MKNHKKLPSTQPRSSAPVPASKNCRRRRKESLIFLFAGLLAAPWLSLAQPAPTLRGEAIAAAPAADPAPATNSAPLHTAASDATATNSTAIPATAAASAKKEKFLEAGFDKLANFNFETGSDAPVSATNAADASRKIMSQIPAPVKALNEKQVAVRGFMLPMRVDKGMVTEFLLLKNQMGCCFGISPGINEWIDVRTSGKGVNPLMDDLLTVYGTLHVGEVRENGYLTGIYRLDCERVQ